ncbi:MAG: CPBP family intramembrane glutamic endopeptidase [Gemmatimonadales bacterium]
MRAIGPASAIYLIVLLVLAPAMGFRSARRFNAPPDSPGRRTIPPLATLYLNSLVMLATLLALAWFTARTFAYEIFALPRLGAREILAGVAALAFQFAMQVAGHAVRTPGERRVMPVHRLMPQSARERALYSAASVAAGVAEEAAYRGVLTAILWYAFENAWVAAGVSALAFALGHAVQRWKSMAVIFVMACSMQLLVWYTGTLVIAMAVHALYDLLAPTVRRRILRVPPIGQERIAG